MKMSRSPVRPDKIDDLPALVYPTSDALKAADEALKKDPNDAKKKDAQKAADLEDKKAAADLKKLEDEIKDLKSQADKEEFKALEKEWRDKETTDAYAADSYRLLLNHSTSSCKNCHMVQKLGPPLERLDPTDRAVRWRTRYYRDSGYSPMLWGTYDPYWDSWGYRWYDDDDDDDDGGFGDS